MKINLQMFLGFFLSSVGFLVLVFSQLIRSGMSLDERIIYGVSYEPLYLAIGLVGLISGIVFYVISNKKEGV